MSKGMPLSCFISKKKETVIWLILLGNNSTLALLVLTKVKMLLFCSHLFCSVLYFFCMAICSFIHVQCYLYNTVDIKMNKAIIFNTWSHILCMTWLPDICDLSTSSEFGYLIFWLSYKRYINSLHLNGSLWELGGLTRFNWKLCWYSMEHMYWL